MTHEYQVALTTSLNGRFHTILTNNLPARIFNLSCNVPLIKYEKQMIIEPLYSPACDVAIGPFSFARGNIRGLYDRLANLPEFRVFIEQLQRHSLGNGYNMALDLNRNPRCLIAIEVENSTARDVKHLLGSISNCSLLSKIGIVIVFDEQLEYAQRLLGYLAFAKRAEKTERTLFGNVFLISRTEFDMILATENY